MNFSLLLQTNEEFTAELKHTNISKYARHTYDAVWAMALTMKKCQEKYPNVQLNKFTYKSRDLVEKLYDIMGSLRFTGVSVSNLFSFSTKILRISWVKSKKTCFCLYCIAVRLHNTYSSTLYV